MCGIAGLIDFNEDARRYQGVYDKMLHKMRGRGSDESGSYLSGKACLLHTRLSVVDIKNGKQPMHVKSGDYEKYWYIMGSFTTLRNCAVN